MLKVKLTSTNISKTIALTIRVLKSGGLIISPSDTVYGLLVDATNETAVKKLTQFKNRPIGKPISVFVADFSMLSDQVEINQRQNSLIKELLPGPFTVILSSKHKVSRLLESEKGSLGVRLPDYSFLNELTGRFGKPITATSANLSGRAPHHSYQSLLNQLPDKKKQLVDLTIDAGQLPKNKPSTVLDLTESDLKIVRKGDLLLGSSKKYLSESALQTKKIAEYIFKKNENEVESKPLIFILQGDLGVGKTVFVKGIAEFLGIKNIVSPTFVIYYEYLTDQSKVQSLKSKVSKLIHVDLYNIEEPDEFKYLGLEKYLRPKNVLCFEWGEKSGAIMDKLKQKGKIVYINMKYIDVDKREIEISY